MWRSSMRCCIPIPTWQHHGDSPLRRQQQSPTPRRRSSLPGRSTPSQRSPSTPFPASGTRVAGSSSAGCPENSAENAVFGLCAGCRAAGDQGWDGSSQPIGFEPDNYTVTHACRDAQLPIVRSGHRHGFDPVPILQIAPEDGRMPILFRAHVPGQQILPSLRRQGGHLPA